jgi:hypothetical protein
VREAADTEDDDRMAKQTAAAEAKDARVFRGDFMGIKWTIGVFAARRGSAFKRMPMACF